MRMKDSAKSKVTLEGLPEFGGETAPELVDHRDHQVVARREMQEHHAMRHAHRFGDLGSGRAGDTLAREQRHGRIDQPVARHHLLFLSGRWLHRSPIH